MIKFAIIGCGAIGRRHAVQCAANGELVAVCDIQEEKAYALAKEFQARAYTGPQDMLLREKELDIVAVCTPNGLHAAHSIQAIKAGHHVICEKPMALHSGDCRQMIAEAERMGKELFIVKQNRFNPPVAAVKKLLDEGRLGRIFSVQLNCCWNRPASYYDHSWHGTRDMDGGLLYTQFSHFIDLLYWMVGDITEVSAFTGNYSHRGIIQFEDAGVACFRFETGAIGSLHFTVNSYKKNMEGALTIVAEKGTVRIGGQYLNTLEYVEMENGVITELVPGGLPNDYGAYQGSMSNHDKMYQHVAEVLEKDCDNQFSGYEGLKTVEIIEKMYKAAK